MPPKAIDEWREYYFRNVRSKEHIEDLGRKLYVKISEVLAAEIEEVTEKDCIDYMFNMVIDRTFDGYMTEIKTIYGQLEKILNVKIQPAPDEWDRLFAVDFFIKINEKYIGLQIKPAGGYLIYLKYSRNTHFKKRHTKNSPINMVVRFSMSSL